MYDFIQNIIHWSLVIRRDVALLRLLQSLVLNKGHLYNHPGITNPARVAIVTQKIKGDLKFSL